MPMRMMKGTVPSGSSKKVILFLKLVVLKGDVLRKVERGEKAKVKAGAVVDVFESSDAPTKAKALKPRLKSPGLTILPSKEARKVKARASPKVKEKAKERKEKEKGSTRETSPTVLRWAKVNPMRLQFSLLIPPLKSPLTRLLQQPLVPLKVPQTGQPIHRRALMSG